MRVGFVGVAVLIVCSLMASHDGKKRPKMPARNLSDSKDNKKTQPSMHSISAYVRFNSMINDQRFTVVTVLHQGVMAWTNNKVSMYQKITYPKGSGKKLFQLVDCSLERIPQSSEEPFLLAKNLASKQAKLDEHGASGWVVYTDGTVKRDT